MQFQRKRGSEQLCEDEEGEMQENAPRRKHVKFLGRVRLLLGVAVVQLLSGEIIGDAAKHMTILKKQYALKGI
eukprot:9760860-Ditylum_brightwellii.AAC.1